LVSEVKNIREGGRGVFSVTNLWVGLVCKAGP